MTYVFFRVVFRVRFRITFRVVLKERKHSCMWGYVKAPQGSSSVP